MTFASFSVKCILKLTSLNMLMKINKIMLITSSHETPYPSPYMGYVGMWVDLGDGPTESVYKSRGGKEGRGAPERVQ